MHIVLFTVNIRIDMDGHHPYLYLLAFLPWYSGCLGSTLMDSFCWREEKERFFPPSSLAIYPGKAIKNWIQKNKTIFGSAVTPLELQRNGSPKNSLVVKLQQYCWQKDQKKSLYFKKRGESKREKRPLPRNANKKEMFFF